MCRRVKSKVDVRLLLRLPCFQTEPLGSTDEPPIVIRHINNSRDTPRRRGARRGVKILQPLGTAAMHLSVDTARKNQGIAKHVALARGRCRPRAYSRDTPVSD